MSQLTDLDRSLADWFQDGPYQAPEEPVEAAIRHALANPRQRWHFASLKGDAMDPTLVAGRPMPSFAAIVAFILLGVAVAVGAAFLLRATVAPLPAPTDQPSGSAASPSPSPTPAPTPSPTPGVTRPPFVQSTEPGDPIPDELLGAWYEPGFPAFPFVFRSGDPYCTTVIKTNQDCTAWILADNGAQVAYTTIATVVDGQLALKWLGGSCRAQKSFYDYSLADGRLTLTDRGGTCGSGDFTFLRPGTNGAPTAPPPPAPSPTP